MITFVLCAYFPLILSWSSSIYTISSAIVMLNPPPRIAPGFHSLHIVKYNTESKVLFDETYTTTRYTERMIHGIQNFLIAPANAQDNLPPTNTEIKLLRSDLDAVYGDKNPIKALPLLSNVINLWESKAPDERAALYRVRGDCLLVCIVVILQKKRRYVSHVSFIHPKIIQP